MQQFTETVSFRLSKEARDLLEQIPNDYNVEGSDLSERFGALLLALDRDLTPASMS